MKYILSFLFLTGTVVSGIAQTILVELDESLGKSKSVVRTVSLPDGETKELEFDDANEAKFAYISAIEKLNMIMLKVEELEMMKFERDGNAFIRYTSMLMVDHSGGGAMNPGGMPGANPEGMPGMEPGGMPGQMPPDGSGQGR